MELNKFLKILLITVIIQYDVQSQTQSHLETSSKIELREIISKQALYNIRFVSNDSSFTIYQKNTGGLFLSTNYSVKKLIDSEENTQFNILGNKNSKIIIISERGNFHQEFNPNYENKIYTFIYDINSKNPPAVNYVGKGITPKSHLNGEFITYFKPSNKKIIIHKLSLPTRKFEIEMPDSPNPYYRPSILILNENEALVKKQNSSGVVLITKTNFSTKNENIIKKGENYFNKFEMCTIPEGILIMQSNYLHSNKKGSKITKIPLKSNKEEILYESSNNDLGNLACNIELGHVFFIKNFSQSEKNYFDVAKLEIKTKKILRLTTEDYITSIFEMDGRLIAVNNGTQMLIIGENSLKKDSIPSIK